MGIPSKTKAFVYRSNRKLNISQKMSVNAPQSDSVKTKWWRKKRAKCGEKEEKKNTKYNQWQRVKCEWIFGCVRRSVSRSIGWPVCLTVVCVFLCVSLQVDSSMTLLLLLFFFSIFNNFPNVIARRAFDFAIDVFIWLQFLFIFFNLSNVCSISSTGFRIVVIIW